MNVLSEACQSLSLGPDTTARCYRDTQRLLGVWIFPLPQSHIHNVFEPVNIINVDNGQTEKTTKSPVSGFAYMGIALPGKGRDGFG